MNRTGWILSQPVLLFKAGWLRPDESDPQFSIGQAGSLTYLFPRPERQKSWRQQTRLQIARRRDDRDPRRAGLT